MPSPRKPRRSTYRQKQVQAGIGKSYLTDAPSSQSKPLALKNFAENTESQPISGPIAVGLFSDQERTENKS